MAAVFTKSFAEVCGGRPRQDVCADNLLAASSTLQKHLEFMQIYLERMAKRGKVIAEAQARPRRVCESLGKRCRQLERIQTKHLLSFERSRKIYQRLKPTLGWSSAKFETVNESPRVPVPTSKRQIKTKRVIYDQPNYDVRNCEPEKFVWPRQCRIGVLCEYLRRRTSPAAVLAEALVVGLCRVYARRDPNFGDKLQDVFPLLKTEETAEGQMEQESTDHGINVSTREQTAGSVVVEEKSVPSVNEPKIVRSAGLAPWSSAKEQQTFSQVAKRWLRLRETYVWKKDMKVGETIASIVLPYQAVYDNESSPNAMPFFNHRYARCDMCVKVMVNSNKFQVGQLQINWFYMASVTEQFKYYDNIHSASQRNHVLVDAGGNNDATIRIPYWHVRSLLSTMPTVEDNDNQIRPLDMGTLTIKVLNQLSTPDNVADKAYISLLVSFENTIFDGVVERGIEKVSGQMDSLINTAESVLHILKGPDQRDNPPAPDPARMFQPMAAHSLGVVNRQNEIIRPMRADPTAQTSGVNAGDGTESLIGDLVRRWSLLTQVDWDTADKAGTQLFSMPVAPVLNPLSYASEEVEGIDYYRLPILSVVSSLFGYFRGGIEVRLDVVGSQFHVGRLQLSVVPGFQKKAIDMDVAKNSVSKYMDISLDRRTEFVGEFFNSVPWARVNYGLDQPLRALPPSTFFLHVVNPLLPMDNVATKIKINVYVRAAADFELSIPRTCPLTTPFSRLTLRAEDIAKFRNGYVPCYTSGSRQFEEGSSSYLSLFYDEITDHFTEFDNFQFGWIYKVPGTVKIGGVDKQVRIPYTVLKSDQTTEVKYVSWLCRAYQYPGYPVALCFDSEEQAKAYAVDKILTRAIVYSGTQGDWLQISDDGKVWRAATSSECLLMRFNGTKIAKSDVEEWEFVDANMESQTGSNTGVTHVVAPPLRTSFGIRTFGEQIDDLRVLARRYQVLGCVSGVFHTKEGQCMANTSPVASISLHPQKLMLSKPQGRDNMVREGVISIIQTGFAGYRGSIRVKIVYTGTSDLVNFCVVHRFDNPTMFGMQSVRPASKIITRPGDFMDTGYATEMQSVNVNPVLEVEVPFYRQGEFNLGYQSTNRDIVNNYAGLGELEIYVTGASGRAKSSDPVNYGFDVFYSVGDDFRFSNFQGFPPMLFLENKNFEPIAPASMEAAARDDLQAALAEAAGEIPESCEGQMDYIKAFFTWPRSLGDLADTLNSCCSTVSGKAARALDAIGSAVTKVKDGSLVRSSFDALSGWASACGDFTIMVLTQVLHIVANPNRTSVGIAIAAILCYVFSERLANIFNTVCDALKWVWHKTFGSKNKQPHSDGKGEAQGQGPSDDESATFVSLLWSIAGTAIGYCVEVPKKTTHFVAGLFKSSTEMFRNHMYGVKFFRDVFEFFQRVWRWINRRLGRTSEFYTLAQDDKALKAWFLTSELILQNREEVKKNRDWAAKAFECQVIGRLYKMAAINSQDNLNKSLLQLVVTTQNKLTEFVDELVEQRECGNFRVAPFAVWICGPPGSGKSEFITKMSMELSKKLGLNGTMYNHVFGAQYFDSLTNQDFLVIDDFLCVKETTTLPTQLAQVLQIMNDFSLSLPRAPVELKKKTDHFKVVIVSSNQDDVGDNFSTAIQEPDAYNRRFHFKIRMTYRDAPEMDRAKQRACHKKYVPSTLTGKAEKTRDPNFDYARFSYSTDFGATWKEVRPNDLIEALSVRAKEVLSENIKRFLKKIEQFHAVAQQAATGALSFEEYFKRIAPGYGVSTDKLDISTECEELSKSMLSKYLLPQIQAEAISNKVAADGASVVKDLADVKVTGAPATKPFSTAAMVHAAPEASTSTEEIQNAEKGSGNMGKKSVTRREEDAIEPAPITVETVQDALESAFVNAMEISESLVPADTLQIVPADVKGAPVLPRSATTQKRGPAVQFRNDPFTESPMCPHEAIGIHGVVPIRLSGDTAAELKGIANDKTDPTFLLINVNKLTKREFGVSAYDSPCVIWDNATQQHVPNSSCFLVTGDEEDLAARRIQLFKNVCEHLRHQEIDPLKIVRDGKIGDYMPIRWFSETVEPLLPKEVPLKQLPKYLINRIVEVLTLGTKKELIGVDGVQHVVDTKLLHRVENSKVIKKGLFFNTAVSETRTEWGTVRTKTVYEPTDFTTVLLLLGIALAFCSYLCVFLDIIIWFIQFYKCFSFASDGQIGTSGDIKMSKSSGSTVKAIQMIKSDGQQGEEILVPLENLSPINSICKRIENNTVFLVAYKEGQVVRRARCLGLYDHTVLGLVHYFDSFRAMKEKDPSVKFGYWARMAKCVVELDLDKLHYSVFETGNFCTFEMPGNFSVMFRNILKYMPHEGKVQYSSHMRLLEVNMFDTVAHELDNVRFFGTEDRKVYAEPTDEWEGWLIPQRLEYGYGGKGVCGSMLIDPSSSTPLVGIHTAGKGTQRGFAEPLVREMFPAGLNDKKPPVEMVTPWVEANLEVETMENVPDGPHIPIGHVPKKEGVVQPSQSKIEPSALFGKWENSTEPAPLSPNDPRTDGFRPLMEGVEKRCDPMKPFPANYLKEAVSDYKQKFLATVKPTIADVAPLSWNDVVCGREGVDFFDPMEMHTSEGYPWVKKRPQGFSDKRWLFDINYSKQYPQLSAMSSELFDVLTLHEKMRDKYIVPCSIYTACLKDARIKKEKINVPGKTRVFEMSPVELTMAQRKYFLPVYAAYMTARFDIEHTIGIRVNGPEWSDLANRLLTFSPYILAGDYSSFGPKAEMHVLLAIVDVHIEWLKKNGYPPEAIRQCEMLKYQILYSPHIIGRYLCKFLAGMPSGNAATVILNSGVNSIYIRIAWMAIMRAHGLGSLDNFHKYVLLFSNGDDIIMAVKPEVIQWFNNETLAAFFASHNLSFTNSKKDKEIVPYERLRDVQYLKCAFRPHPQRRQWLAELDISTIYETPLWVWKSREDLKVRTAQNVDQALRLAYGHGPDKFEEFKQFLIQHCQDLDLYVPLPTWIDLDIMIWDKGEDLLGWFWG